MEFPTSEVFKLVVYKSFQISSLYLGHNYNVVQSQESSDESQDSSDESQDSSDESQDSSDESQDSSDEYFPNLGQVKLYTVLCVQTKYK